MSQQTVPMVTPDFQQKYGISEDRAQAIINKALKFKAMGKEYRDDVQEQLADLGRLALPPRGHSCPDCNTAGTMYCLTVAVERFRGTRND